MAKNNLQDYESSNVIKERYAEIMRLKLEDKMIEALEEFYSGVLTPEHVLEWMLNHADKFIIENTQE